MNYLFIFFLSIISFREVYSQNLLLPGYKSTSVRKVIEKDVFFKVKALKIKDEIIDQKFFVLDKKKKTILAVLIAKEVTNKGFARALIIETLVEDNNNLVGYPVVYSKHLNLKEEEQKLGAGLFTYGVTLANPSLLSTIYLSEIQYHFLPSLIGYDSHPRLMLKGFGLEVFPPYLRYSSWLSRLGLLYKNQNSVANKTVPVETPLNLPDIKMSYESESITICYRPYYDGFISRAWFCLTPLERSASKLSWQEERYVVTVQGMGLRSGLELMLLYPGVVGINMSFPLKQTILMSATETGEMKQGRQSLLVGELYAGIRYRFSQIRAGFVVEALTQYSFYSQKISMPGEESQDFVGSEYHLRLGLGYIF